MNLQQVLLILRAHFRIALLVLIVTVSVAVLVTLQLPKQYTATSSVFIDIKPDPIAGVMSQAMVIPGYVPTQVDIIKSDRVAQRVVKILKLDESATARQQWLEATNGSGNITVWLAELLQARLDVKPSRESSVINLQYKAVDPAFAAAVANAFAESYIQTNIELKVEPAQQYSAWFMSQSRTLRENLEKAQSKLSDYQQKHGIVASDERVDNETKKLDEISSQLTAAQGLTADALSKQRSGNASDTLPEIVQNPLITGLKSEIARLESRLQEFSINYGKNHPQYQRTAQELDTLKQTLVAETKHISSGFSTSGTVGKDRETTLRASFEAQKRKLLDLRRERDEVSVLMRDVDSAQKAYDAVAQRFNQTQLESRTTQTNVSILTAATPPLSPSNPKMWLNVLMSFVLGSILGVGASFLIELMDRRVRSTTDVSEMLNLPVLGVVSRVKSRRRLPIRRSSPPALPAT